MWTIKFKGAITMAILSKVDIGNFNNKMLGLGAPIYLDGQGYNKPDYNKMIDFSGRDFTKLTDKQLWFVAVTLGKYKNTQLTAYKADLEETINHYADLRNKATMVRVIKETKDEVSIQWGYNKIISDKLKTSLDRAMYRWTKENDVWTLNVKWEYVSVLIDEFNAAKVDSTLLKQAYEKQVSLTVNPQQKQDVISAQVHKCTLKVYRQPNSVDTLAVSFKYSPDVIKILKETKGLYNEKTKTWSIPIEQASTLYNALPDTFDKATLKPWADLVNGWKTTHTLVDLSKYNLKFKPYDFQPKDAERLLQLQSGLNGNEVGCGKTFEMVIIGESIPMKKLVICPATLRLNWEREIKMVNPNAQVHIQYSDKPFKVVDGWNIIGYPSLAKFQSELENQLFQVVMADEAHYIQAVNAYGKPNSKRANAVLRIAATSQYVFPITGTPKTNRNVNLYNILRMLRHPLTRGKYAFKKYIDYYCDAQQTPWGLDFSGNSHDKELNEVLAPLMVRHLKCDVLPELKKQRQSIPVQVNLREYFRLIDEYMKARKNHEAEALVTLTRAKQVVAIQKAHHSIEFAKDIVERGEKVVITTCFTEVVEQICQAFPKCLKIVGGMSDKQKQAAIDEFQNGTAQVIVLNYTAGGVGITLTASSTMIMNDLPWVVGDITQAEGRIYRAGQKNTAMVYFMTAIDCPMDERLVDMIVYKSNTINKVVDNGLGDEIDLRKLIDETIA